MNHFSTPKVHQQSKMNVYLNIFLLLLQIVPFHLQANEESNEDTQSSYLI